MLRKADSLFCATSNRLRSAHACTGGDMFHHKSLCSQTNSMVRILLAPSLKYGASQRNFVWINFCTLRIAYCVSRIAYWARLRIFRSFDHVETFSTRFKFLQIRAVHQRWTLVRWVNSLSIPGYIVYTMLGSLIAFATLRCSDSKMSSLLHRYSLGWKSSWWETAALIFQTRCSPA